MRCTSCAPNTNKEPALPLDAFGNSLGCTCMPGHVRMYNPLEPELAFECLTTCIDRGEAVSFYDEESCAKCDGGAVYDVAGGTCGCEQPTVADADGKAARLYLQETILSVGDDTMRNQTCVKCDPGQAVFTAADVGEAGYKTTAGVNFYVDLFKCQECPDQNMHFDANLDCRCKSGWDMVGVASVGPEYCVSTTTGGSFYDTEFENIQVCVVCHSMSRPTSSPTNPSFLLPAVARRGRRQDRQLQIGRSAALLRVGRVQVQRGGVLDRRGDEPGDAGGVPDFGEHVRHADVRRLA